MKHSIYRNFIVSYLMFALLGLIVIYSATTQQTYDHILQEKASSLQSGTITIKGKKFRATTPIATIWYDGKTQWTYNKKSDEVNIASPSASTQQSMNPYYFLNLYKQGYTKSMTKTGKGYDIHLVGKGRKISEMYVTIDKNYNLKQIQIKQGNEWMTISVSGVRNVTPSDSFFRFNSKDYPKAEVIDLR